MVFYDVLVELLNM